MRAPNLNKIHRNSTGFTQHLAPGVATASGSNIRQRRTVPGLSAGFTIIEIMIVLAVASLIMLIVFLAVPALQRNARNTNRTSDATKVASAVNECLSNRNNFVDSCNESGEIKSKTLDTDTLRQLTEVQVGSNANGGTVAFPGDSKTAWVFFSQKCGTDGSTFSAGNSQQFVVLYNNESSGGSTISRCISG